MKQLGSRGQMEVELCPVRHKPC